MVPDPSIPHSISARSTPLVLPPPHGLDRRRPPGADKISIGSDAVEVARAFYAAGRKARPMPGARKGDESGEEPWEQNKSKQPEEKR